MQPNVDLEESPAERRCRPTRVGPEGDVLRHGRAAEDPDAPGLRIDARPTTGRRFACRVHPLGDVPEDCQYPRRGRAEAAVGEAGDGLRRLTGRGSCRRGATPVHQPRVREERPPKRREVGWRARSRGRGRWSLPQSPRLGKMSTRWPKATRACRGRGADEVAAAVDGGPPPPPRRGGHPSPSATDLDPGGMVAHVADPGRGDRRGRRRSVTTAARGRCADRPEGRPSRRPPRLKQRGGDARRGRP